MILAVNMVGSSIYTVLALIAVVIQSCQLTNAKADHHTRRRNHNSNSNFNTNINTYRKGRRFHDAMARSDLEKSPENGKDVQTAVIASAAADAAKSVTHEITKRLSDTTADAVADAVVRVLTEETEPTKPEPNEQDAVTKVARRASRFLNNAIARLMYYSEPEPPSETSTSSVNNVPEEIVAKMLEATDQEEANDKFHWVDGDGTEYTISAADIEEEEGASENNRMHRRFLDNSEFAWKQNRRSTPSNYLTHEHRARRRN